MGSKTECLADFIVVRVPRLSLNKIKDLPGSALSLNDYLSGWLATPGILEAIYLASPSLAERLEIWRDKPESKSGRKVTTALLKYLIRMCSRPTPFGLFSGVAVGSLSDSSNFKPEDLQQDSRKTRLDMFYLSTIQQQWAQSEEGRRQLCYKPNTTLYRLGSYLHYIESYQSSQRHYRLSSVELDEALESMLRLSGEGQSESKLAQLFGQEYPEASKADIENYIQQLIKEQVLVAELKLPLTSGQPDQAFVRQLLQVENKRDGELLQAVLDQLEVLDQKGAAEPNDYQTVVTQLKQLPYPVSENKLFQTDSWRAMKHCQLDRSLLTILENTVLALKAQSGKRDSPFKAFVTSFQQRFEGQFVPLLPLLDEESGIPFSAETGYETPLLAGINIANRHHESPGQPQNPLEQLVVNAMQHQGRVNCIQLSSNEILKDTDRVALWQKLPSSYALNISYYLDDNRQPLIHFHGCSGPSGANLLGRFCHLNSELLQQVRQYLAAEEALSPTVIFAEVVHMPDGRPGNVIARPPLRNYEIVFLADTVSPDERQIPVQDLYVFVEAGQVKLWSKRLNKQIVPRLTSAHNYSGRSLGVYRFLCVLQHQQGRLPHFSSPANFSQMDYQPRIQLDNVILHEAQWQIDRSMLEALVVNNQWQREAWDAIAQRYQLCRYVCYAISDNVLIVDLHNPAMIDLLLCETAGQPRIKLKESLAMQYESAVVNDEGNFAHEILVPMLNPQAAPFETLHPNPAKQLDMTVQRYFAPGSEWLSLKIYAANSTAELVLIESLTPFLRQYCQQGLVKSWFFIRYADPDWHLRLRLFGEPAALCGQLLPLLQKQLASWLSCQRISKIEVFTYQREVERYGGDIAMLYCEQIFQADSEFVLSSLQLISEHGESVRWRMALLGIDTMLDAFGYDLSQKLKLISGLRESFGQEFQEHAKLRSQLGLKFRDCQQQLRQDFQAMEYGSAEQPRPQMLKVRQQFLQQLQPAVLQLLALENSNQLSCTLDILLHSLLHMFNNRIFKAYGREQEFVVYDFLRRYYLSCQSRQELH
ncbi:MULTISPECIES: lantibiotic dehydratase [unclassified Arsukibacterium]|uniref:lantibiotic dehydratase n=1 Tax=unclassified Arsukibacterium TaxID=2635278 RepID=UPI000C356DAA|nr:MULTISPECIES: lantibiotic dehydratase [unclassified Arsukibacterium]MAA95937.1 lantibiotic dehydratase [Rheinheimera sp.]MBM34759.1 lantibiotic dehydratase [Rheinheimera sp.]HAW91656.1 lantibiotic dehydratase [Candidatus Azambacteria bacterium]|tara:strand:+ start:50948 stop:54079 length:3132 start_codon:yes stop_codon:yes gene_type:complete